MQLHVVQAGHIDLRSILGGDQPSPMASGEFKMGDSFFDSPMLVETHGSDGFDISLDDDFSFTPSAMSLESLDGFELPAGDALSKEQPASPVDAGDDEAGDENPPDTGYATVMMDVTSVTDGTSSIDPGNLFDEPIQAAVDSAEISLEPLGDLVEPPVEPPNPSADAAFELPDMPPDDIIIEPDLASAELRSSILGRTSDLDLTSMELRRTTRDIDMLNQLKEEAEAESEATPAEPEAVPLEAASSQDSAELLIVDFDVDPLNETAQPDADPGMPDLSREAAGPPSDDILSAELSPDTTELAFPVLDDEAVSLSDNDASNADLGTLNAEEWVEDENDLEASLIDDAASYGPGLPSTFPDEPDDPEDLNNESGELILPSLDTQFLAPDATASPLTDSTVSHPTGPLEMPELPDNASEEPAPSLFTDEISLIDNDLPDIPPPLQTSVFSPVTPEETTIVDEQSIQTPEQPETELELGNPDAPKPTDAFLAATPEEVTIADEQSPMVPMAEPSTTETPEAFVLPELPEQTDAFLTPSPEEATIVDEQPPPLPTAGTPVDFTIAPPDTGFATVKLDIDHAEPPEAPVLPELPELTDAFLTPSPEEATIVDEQPPPLPAAGTPVDFTIAPPDTGFATIKLDIDHAEPPEAPVLPELPELTDAFLTPSPEEVTIVDEQPPMLPTNDPPGDTGETTLQLEMDEFDGDIDEEVDHELLFPDEPEASSQKPKKPKRDTDS